MATHIHVRQTTRGSDTHYHSRDDLSWQDAMHSAYTALGLEYQPDAPFAILVNANYVEVSDPQAQCVLRCSPLDAADYDASLSLEAPRRLPQMSGSVKPARVQRGPISAHGLDVDWD